MEKVRDRLIRALPVSGHRLSRIEKANLLFLRTALNYRASSVFADVSKDPYRIRHLAAIQEIDLRILYLVRDVRGVVVSNMRERASDARSAARIWLWDQHDILRITADFPPPITVFYEDLCTNVNATLFEIHRFLGLTPKPYPGNFKTSEHHILGNSMRTQETSEIRLETRWMSSLKPGDLKAIRLEAENFLSTHPRSAALPVIQHYLDADGW